MSMFEVVMMGVLQMHLAILHRQGHQISGFNSNGRELQELIVSERVISCTYVHSVHLLQINCFSMGEFLYTQSSDDISKVHPVRRVRLFPVTSHAMSVTAQLHSGKIG